MADTQARFGVLGAGSYGTAIAIQLARRGADTYLWGRNADAIARMQSARNNADYLPDCPFPTSLIATAELDDVLDRSEHLFLVVPSQALGETLRRITPKLRPGQGLACACKGFEVGSGRLAHEVVADVLDDARKLAIVSGPTFARELGMGLPSAVTVAAKDQRFAEQVVDALHGDGFRAYTSNDLIGVQVGGAAKNVMAIAVGIADGLGLGANTRAALITRGLAEIMRLGEALGARAETLMGLSGMGDLVLTCTDNQSRNRRFGLLLAKGKTPQQASAEIRQVVEGLKAAPEVARLAARHQVEMPITEQVVRVIQGEISAVEAVRNLARRPAKAETE
ncbi:MAG: NAD(P)H-dependent glycerol-3-phosphate dehydrogenase [Panacagrimonas sp.]